MLTVKQVAAMLACSEPNVYDLARSGKLPCVRVGSNGAGIRFRESDVERFLADGGQLFRRRSPVRFWSVVVWLFVMSLLGHAAVYSLPYSLAYEPWWIVANVALVTITASAFATLLELRESRPTAEP